MECLERWAGVVLEVLMLFLAATFQGLQSSVGQKTLGDKSE